MKNLVIGQSGGPTAVINASLCGAVQAWKEAGQEGRVYGMLNGIEGFLADQVTDLTALSEEELKLLRLTPAAYLGSCRFKLPEDLTDAVYSAVFDNLREMNIGYFLYVGGNDSMDTVDKLSRFAARSMAAMYGSSAFPRPLTTIWCSQTIRPVSAALQNMWPPRSPGDRPGRLCIPAEICDDHRDHGTPRRLAHSCLKAGKKI